MDMIHYENTIEEQRFKQATHTIKEIGELVDTFYNRQSRTNLQEENEKLRRQNLELKRELKKYKQIISDIKLLQGDKG